MNLGIVIIGENDPAIAARAKQYRIALQVSKKYELTHEKTLFVSPGVLVPWDLLPAACHFLDRWDAACPLWKYGVTADQIGEADERALTTEILPDLRVLLYAHELLFVRKNEAGQALLETWRRECERGADERLAFLRAYYQVKPRLCVLPISWLGNVRGASIQHMHARRPGIERKKSRLVRVSIGKGRYVKCAPEDVEKVKAQYNQGV